jgi:HAD superfamily hydrolase (TIGR01509 family)
MTGPELEAAIFDVDGTLAETERHGHRVAFNKAFEELGLEDRWDEQFYGNLLEVSGGERRLFHYLTAYQNKDAEKAAELASRLHASKTRLFVDVVSSGKVPARKGVLRLLKELEEEGVRLALATTGTRSWVLPLVEKLTEMGNLTAALETIVTGDDVSNLKPDPEAFVLALERLGLEPSQALIVEDSKNGVKAAKAAACCCVAVKGEYAKATELMDADLLVDEFGEADSALRVLNNPLGIEAGPLLTPAVLRKVHEAWLDTRLEATGSP